MRAEQDNYSIFYEIRTVVGGTVLTVRQPLHTDSLERPRVRPDWQVSEEAWSKVPVERST